MKLLTPLLCRFTISVLIRTARGDALQIQQFSDPNHPGMLA
jgi:hypothetical protein